jgi:hypothetical protein
VVTANMVGAMRGWDPYPFILLNLAVSFQAAYAAPVIMMSQNRQQDIDRKAAENDYRINVKADQPVRASARGRRRRQLQPLPTEVGRGLFASLRNAGREGRRVCSRVGWTNRERSNGRDFYSRACSDLRRGGRWRLKALDAGAGVE